MDSKQFNKFLKDRGIKTVVGLDFETHFAQGYSLRSTKNSMTEYIRDKRFNVHCVGIRTNRQRKARWFPHSEIPRTLSKFDWSTTALLAHNTAFDGLISSHHYKIAPAYYFCSMSMARPLFSHSIGAGLDEVARHLGYGGKVKADALEATKGIADLGPELMIPLGEYCADDVDDMWSIFRDMLAMDFPADELDLIHHTIKAYADPMIEIDRPRVEAELAREIKMKKQLVAKATKILRYGVEDALVVEDEKEERRKRKKVYKPGETAGMKVAEKRYHHTSKILNSNPQFAEALRANGQEPPKKISPTTNKPTFAFAKNDLGFQALEKHPNKDIRDLYAARLVSKSTIGETRARRILSHSENGAKFPMMLNYARAHTLRWSGGDKCNVQNFPRGGELRKSLRAPKGYKIVVVDSSQIEDRTNCAMAGQNEVLDQYRAKKDVYSLLASDIYNRPIDKKKDPNERFVGKVARLGLGYGMGGDKFQNTLETGAMGPPVLITPDEATKIVSIYRRKNFHIVNQWKFADKMLRVMLSGGEYTYKDILTFHPDGVDLPNGLMLHYPKLRAKYNPRFESYSDFEYWNGDYFTKLYGGLFVENFIQCLARIIVGEQVLKIAEFYRILTLTHDECVYLALAKKAEEAYHYGIKCFSTPPSWLPDIPLAAEGGYDDVYSK